MPMWHLVCHSLPSAFAVRWHLACLCHSGHPSSRKAWPVVLAHPLHEHDATCPCDVTYSEYGLGNPQGWGGADATAALRDAGDAAAALASRALELEAELAALDHSMMQVPRSTYTHALL